MRPLPDALGRGGGESVSRQGARGPWKPEGEGASENRFQKEPGRSLHTRTRGSQWPGGWCLLRPNFKEVPAKEARLGPGRLLGARESEDDLLGWAAGGGELGSRRPPTPRPGRTGQGVRACPQPRRPLPRPRPPATPAGPEAALPPPRAAQGGGVESWRGRAGLCSGPATCPTAAPASFPNFGGPARRHGAGSGGEANPAPRVPHAQDRVRPRLSHWAPARGRSAGLTPARPGGRAHTHSGVGRRPPSSAWRGWGFGSAPSPRT